MKRTGRKEGRNKEMVRRRKEGDWGREMSRRQRYRRKEGRARKRKRSETEKKRERNASQVYKKGPLRKGNKAV